MANEALTDEAMARIERHMTTERQVREQAKAQRLRSANTSPEGWQEPHDKAEEVRVAYRQDGSKRVERILCRRRVLEARLWDGLDPSLQDAAVAIERGFSLVTRGMGHKPPSYELGTAGKGAYSDRDVDAMADYWGWAKEAVRQRVDRAAIILVLADGWACKAVDEARRKRKGYARTMLVDGLNLFCVQRGWSTQRTIDLGLFCARFSYGSELGPQDQPRPVLRGGVSVSRRRRVSPEQAFQKRGQANPTPIPERNSLPLQRSSKMPRPITWVREGQVLHSCKPEMASLTGAYFDRVL